MARYSPEHKEATRRRMIETAGRRFKSDGLDGSGIATLVADAGLTNGAFYGHFTSKDDLIASVVAQQLADQVAVVSTLPTGLQSLEAFIRDYLSPAHRDDRADGCPSAALLDEIARRATTTRQVFTDELLGTADDIAARLNPTDASRIDALTLFGFMIGTLQVARALTDQDLSNQLLARGVETALKLLDDWA